MKVMVGSVRRLRVFVLAFVLSVVATFAPAAGLCPAETGFDRSFLTLLLEIPSVTADVAEANRAVDFTREYLAKSGVRCAVETDGAGRKVLWAATEEGKTPDYVLVVHLDVVPAEADQFKVRIEGAQDLRPRRP